MKLGNTSRACCTQTKGSCTLKCLDLIIIDIESSASLKRLLGFSQRRVFLLLLFTLSCSAVALVCIHPPHPVDILTFFLFVFVWRWCVPARPLHFLCFICRQINSLIFWVLTPTFVTFIDSSRFWEIEQNANRMLFLDFHSPTENWLLVLNSTQWNGPCWASLLKHCLCHCVTVTCKITSVVKSSAD